MIRKMTITTLLFAVIALTVGLLSQHRSPHTVAPGMISQAASLLSPRVLQASTDKALTLSDVAEKVVGGVVNISTEKEVTSKNQHPSFGPFKNDPFFKRFFHPSPEGRETPQKHREKSLGSGVIISADGIILTNNHVIENADKIKVVLSDGREFEAEIVGADADSDLGVLRLKGKVSNLKPLRFGDSSRLRLGEMVLAVGNPFGVGQTVTMGIVSAKGRANVGIVAYEDFIQTDAAINPGNSGGALVNMQGELVGINTAILSRSGGYQGIGFSIPVNMAQPIMQSLLKYGKVSRGWLGVSIQNLTPELQKAMHLKATKGVLISDLLKGSPAEKAGLQLGDLVVGFNAKKLDNGTQLHNWVANAGARVKVKIEVLRANNLRSIWVTLGEKPSKQSKK